MLFGGLSGAAVMLAELAVEAGLPNGVLNIVHGTNVSLEFGLNSCSLVLVHSQYPSIK